MPGRLCKTYPERSLIDRVSSWRNKQLRSNSIAHFPRPSHTTYTQSKCQQAWICMVLNHQTMWFFTRKVEHYSPWTLAATWTS
jgi:hypothetical protein